MKKECIFVLAHDPSPPLLLFKYNLFEEFNPTLFSRDLYLTRLVLIFEDYDMGQKRTELYGYTLNDEFDLKHLSRI